MYYNRANKSKYNSKKIYAADGMKFDSRKEYQRYLYLKDKEKDGYIKDLKTQVKYILIPAQREPDQPGKRGGIKKGKVIERECAYFADFVYYDCIKNCEVVEDVKGYKAAGAYNLFTIKRKLMLYVHGIKINEI